MPEAKEQFDRPFLHHPLVAITCLGEGNYGLVAHQDISKNTAVISWHLDPSIRNQRQQHFRVIPVSDSFGRYHDRGFTAAPNVHIGPTPKHPLYYINHECYQPSTGFIGYGPIADGTLSIYSLRDIAAGEQITLDYSTLTGPGEGKPPGTPWQMEGCECGRDNCRHTVTDWEHLSNLDQQVLVNDQLVLAYLVADTGFVSEIDTFFAALDSQVALAMLLNRYHPELGISHT